MNRYQKQGVRILALLAATAALAVGATSASAANWQWWSGYATSGEHTTTTSGYPAWNSHYHNAGAWESWADYCSGSPGTVTSGFSWNNPTYVTVDSGRQSHLGFTNFNGTSIANAWTNGVMSRPFC